MEQWFALAGIIIIVCLVWWLRKNAYQQGIWDGAFNKSLPHVQKHMIDYDPQGALDMLTRSGIPVQVSVLHYAADNGAHPRHVIADNDSDD